MAISDKELQQVAKDCAQRIGVTGFKASGSWLRGWKGRCQEEGLVDRGCGRRRATKTEETRMKEQRTKNGIAPDYNIHDSDHVKVEVMCLNHSNTDVNHSQTTPTASQQLSMLTEEEKRGVAIVGGAIASNEPALSYPDNQLCTDRKQSYEDYNTPEHNYCHTHTSHDQQISPDQPDNLTAQSCDQGNLASCFQVCLGELLGDMQSHDPHVQLLHLGEEVGVAERVEPQDNALLSLSSNELPSAQSVFPHHTHSEFSGHASSLLEAEEEEQLMSVFNHRSFTDHFPFLPPALFSNWCPPYDPPHTQLSTDSFPQTIPTYDRASGTRSMVNATTSPSHPEGAAAGVNYQVQTRSMVRAKAAAASVNAGPSIIASLPGLISPSSSPPPGLGGVSLLSCVVSSPPGGGLLANRLSQPNFPDEPEIIFHEIVLGPLHTTPATIAATPPQLP